MSELDQIIRAEIGEAGAISFERFMELALYQPQFGYYAKAPAIGRRGDFYTSVSVGPLFGRLLARQFLQMWQLLGQPEPFWIIEQGAHDGQLARDILGWCHAEAPDFFQAVRYVIVGSSQFQFQEDEADFSSHILQVKDLSALAKEKPVGVFVSNELIDAFPVRAIARRGDKWVECGVTIREGVFAWTDLPINDEALLQAIAERPIPGLDDYTTEINLRAPVWMREVGSVLSRGYVVTIDYGYPASVYYASHRSGGTLTAFRKHRANEDLLTDPGGQDLTAHVDFTVLARAGEEVGLKPLGFVDQQRFLMGVAHDELSEKEGPRAGIAENKLAWQSLTHPEHLGASFQVLVQGKDAPVELDGLRFARPGGLD